jgi:hypothetical protein
VPPEVDLPEPHPKPPADLNDRSLLIRNSLGPWIRSHRRDYGAIHFGRSGSNRFDAPTGEYGVLYVAVDVQGAFVETFGRQIGRMIIAQEELEARALSSVVARRPLKLVDLVGSGLARIGADGRVATGDYSISQPWGLALYHHPEQPDGLLYRSRHDPSRVCVAIFDRVADILIATSLGSLADVTHEALLAELLNTYGISLIE